MNDVQNRLLNFWNTISHKVITALPEIVVGVVIFLAAWVVSIIVKRSILRLSKRSKNRIYLFRILGSLAKTTILIMGFIMGLGTMGVNVGALVASLGLVGFAVSFALKDTLSNMISGFVVLFYQPFKEGDFITVSSSKGRVVDISLRYTIIRTEEDHTYMPNSMLLTNPLIVKDKEDEPSHE